MTASHAKLCWIDLQFTPEQSGVLTMMGPRQMAQGALFYDFSIEDHVPADHLLRQLDRFVDLSEIRSFLAPFYSATGRPSVDPELMIRMLIVGYRFGIRSERKSGRMPSSLSGRVAVKPSSSPSARTPALALLGSPSSISASA